jgi:DNA replication and repair protein RecF
MIIQNIWLRHFRNYREEYIEFHDRINVVRGKNAQGKTNLIEAVNLLSMAKSFRTQKEQEMIGLGEDVFSVKGEFLRNSTATHSVEVVLRANGPAQKQYFVNGVEKASIFDLLGGVYTIVFSPEDLRIVKGGPEVRRRFLDREAILLRPMYYHKLKKYRGVIRRRNALLKHERPSPDLLDVYDEQLAEAGAAVIAERAAYVEKLNEASKKTASEITSGAELLDIRYKSNIPLLSEGQEGCFLDLLRKSRDRDLMIRSTENGPHRDDLSIFANGKDLRVYGSQGQQRTAALAIRLAENEMIRKETGENAILLLDDVMSELDGFRQEKILSGFEKNQVFITSAEIHEKALGALGESKTITIENGRLI